MLNRDLKLPIPCPQCEQKIEETIARLETNPNLTCPNCGLTFGIKADDLKAKLKEVEKMLADFGRNISRLK